MLRLSVADNKQRRPHKKRYINYVPYDWCTCVSAQNRETRVDNRARSVCRRLQRQGVQLMHTQPSVFIRIQPTIDARCLTTAC